MSGQQIGTAVGFVAGFFLPGGPQVWAGIGGMIGGAISPTTVSGPRMSDGMAVTANDGIPNPWGFGTFAIGCNIINSFDLKEHKHTDDGKGSGVEQETFTYTRSYAVGICRAKRREDGLYDPIAGVLRATHNGKVVYNTMPDATPQQLAQNAKFLETFKFYLGGEDQLPDPTLESYMDAGNVSAYRGQVYMVATDEDQTQSGGSIGTWEFVVSMEGEVQPEEETLRPGRLAAFVNSDWPLGDPESGYDFEGFVPGYGSFTATSVSDAMAQCASISGRNPSVYLGYSATTSVSNIPSIGLDIDTLGVSNVVAQPSVVNNTALVLVYNENGPDLVKDQTLLNDACSYTPTGLWVQSRRGKVSTRFASDPGGDWSLDQTCGDGQVYGLFPFCIRVTRKRVEPGNTPPAGGVSIPDAPDFYVMPDGSIGRAGESESVTGTFQVLNVPATQSLDGRTQYAYYENGPAIEDTDPNYNDSTFWTAAYNAALSAGAVPSGWTFGVNYPAPVTEVWRSLPLGFDLLDPSKVLLSTIVAEVSTRSGLALDDVDVSQLTDLVGGFKVAVETTGEAVIQSLMQGFFFDAGEWDDKLRFIKRGGDTVFALTVDDLAERDGPVIEETEAQEVELLRKVHIRTMDPAAGYVETTQTAERRSSTVAAKGEQTVALPIVMDKDTQARIGDKRLKVGWSELRRFAFDLPYTRPDLTPTDVGTITDRKGRTQRIRLMEMSEDSGRIEVSEAMLDRQSSYTSDVEGITVAPPTDTSPGLIGPTNFYAGNWPSLRTRDNVPGMYIGACGYMPAWGGASILISVDGGTSFQQVATFSQASTMGSLVAPVGENDEPISVFMNSGALSSVTDEQLASRMNAFAIDTGGVAEIGQFKTATLVGGTTYDLTENIRGALGTEAAAHEAGDPFIMASTAQFLPLDISLAGRLLIFKAVSYGTRAEDAAEYPVVFSPIFTSVLVDPYTTDSGDTYVDNTGSIYYRTT